MISALLDIAAPRARARLEVELNTNLENFVSKVKSEYTLIESKGRQHKFRVNGDFFSSLEATGVVAGKKANPEHYGKVGFNLTIENGKGSKIILKAEERIILGYLEIIALSSALENMLHDLAKKYDREESL